MTSAITRAFRLSRLDDPEGERETSDRGFTGCHAVRSKEPYVSPTNPPSAALTDIWSRDKAIEQEMETMRHAEGRPQAKRVFRFRIRSKGARSIARSFLPPLSLPPLITIACSSFGRTLGGSPLHCLAIHRISTLWSACTGTIRCNDDAIRCLYSMKLEKKWRGAALTPVARTNVGLT